MHDVPFPLQAVGDGSNHALLVFNQQDVIFLLRQHVV